VPPKSDKPPMRELITQEQARGIELVVTPVLFGAMGWLLDSWLGTTPWLAIALGTFALLGTIAKIWFTYDAQMRELETTSGWFRRAEVAAAPDDDADLWADRRTQA
jgi:hypothetical protein